MGDFLHRFVLAFVPMFVAVDPIGLLPLYVGLTGGFEPSLRRRILGQALVIALAIAVGFILFGDILFAFIGVTVHDFQVAGGVLLFAISSMDIISSRHKRGLTVEGNIGAVPLGTPLIAGPAVLTASLILVGSQGLLPTLLAVAANIGLAGLVLAFAGALTRLLGDAGSRAVSKVSYLILAAFAVMMIRQGVMGMMLMPK